MNTAPPLITPYNKNAVVIDNKALQPIGGSGQSTGYTPPNPTANTQSFVNGNLVSSGNSNTNSLPDDFYNPAPAKQAVDQTATYRGNTYNLSTKEGMDAYKAAINSPTSSNTPTVDPMQKLIANNQAKLDATNAQYDQDAQTFRDAAEAYQNGSTPLSAGQNAQIQGLQQQYQQLIDNQKLVNTGAQGTANIRGYQKGAAEYDPTFQANIIGNIFSAGQAKVASLQTKMASAVANLTSQFQAENYKGVKDAWDEYQDYAEGAKKEFASNMEQAQKAISAAKEQQAQAERDTTVATLINNGYTNPSEILQALNENGASYTAKEIEDTIGSLIKSNSYPGGIVGEYQFYNDQEKSSGRIPLSFNDYQTLDANRKAAIARAGVGATGLDSATLNQALRVAGQFDSEPGVKSYQVVAEAEAFVDSLGTGTTATAGQDQGLLYAFAKAMDPNSVVREGEYNTVQRYAQSYADTFKFDVKRINSNTPFLTDDARQQMKTTIALKAKTAKNAYQNTYDSYGQKINKITGQTDGTDYITNYAKGFPNKDGLLDPAKNQESEKKVQQIYTEHADAIDKLVQQNPSISNEEILQILGY